MLWARVPRDAQSVGYTLYGEGTDPAGNIFFNDTGNEIMHKVDARSGIMTVLAGGATTVGCAGQADKFGDNCLAATQTGAFNNPRGMTIDPYGNAIIAGYSEQLVQIVCNALSPLCTAGQVGYMRIIAGYSASSSSAGTAAVARRRGLRVMARPQVAYPRRVSINRTTRQPTSLAMFILPTRRIYDFAWSWVRQATTA